ncbi:basic-leucine zipper transcription factor A-like [Abeliophyllum distichum]|uniref:Basic-leucine zipper transcription factor A-like n=1 Tax=Abeliophyllum distichum TaxID=126358 RepID=A0ABD1QXJ7_9LAMI
MSAENWQKCIDFFTSPTFVERSTKNKANRSKAKYPSVQGLKSFSATHYDKTQVGSSGALVDERAIAKEVLGERLEHIHGVGRVSKGTSPSLDSTAALKTLEGTFHQFSGDLQNEDPRFAMYEAQLCQMQQKIQRLKKSISGVVPEEEDKDKSLGDL